MMIKSTYIFFEVVNALISLILSAAGVSMISGFAMKGTPNLVLLSQMYFLLVNILVLICAIVGCCCVCQPCSCLIQIYSFIQFGIFGAYLIIIIVYAAQQNSLAKGLQKQLKTVISDQKINSTKPDKYLDFIQVELKCCGYNDYLDYEKVPKSCCKVKNCDPSNNKTIHTTGCNRGYAEMIGELIHGQLYWGAAGLITKFISCALLFKISTKAKCETK